MNLVFRKLYVEVIKNHFLVNFLFIEGSTLFPLSFAETMNAGIKMHLQINITFHHSSIKRGPILLIIIHPIHLLQTNIQRLFRLKLNPFYLFLLFAVFKGIFEVAKHDAEEWKAINRLMLIIRKHNNLILREHLLQICISLIIGHFEIIRKITLNLNRLHSQLPLQIISRFRFYFF